MRGKIITMTSTNKASSIKSRVRDLRHESTEAEGRLWSRLRAHRLSDIHFRRQYPVGPYIVDFCAPERRLVIEVDGSGHLDQVEYDQERSGYLETAGYKILRFWNDEILKDVDTVLGVILETLEHPSKK